ncbi:MAG: hypothetical protein HY791_12365 [Deltaproteobacteria bacterium]|nr:hypothetical protein [Deltaproteobacteria bacterium]
MRIGQPGQYPNIDPTLGQPIQAPPPQVPQYPQGYPQYAPQPPVYVPYPVMQPQAPSAGSVILAMMAGAGMNAMVNASMYGMMPYYGMGPMMGSGLWSPFPMMDNWDGGFNFPGPF